ncbi:DUF3631 domain-containing protein [Streptomyces sp. NPDC003717]|uniref:DUF3631 domain-containing protein n=1 Tax=Streptomyces sp. NPDC003717 TaxID=3154276 RepID=UPI0033A55C7F
MPGQPGAHLRSAQADGATADAYDGPADPDPARGLEAIPNAEPTPGSKLLDELRFQIAQFVIPPSFEALDAITLWVAATQLQPAWQHAPRLAVVGPAKRCGKSRLLDVLTETVHEPMLTINTTPAAIFRSINEAEPPTLLVDEADTIFGPKVAEKNEETRGLLNAGHQRGRYVTRVVGNDHTPHKFATFAMAAIAGIGDLPDTVMDRSVVIRMRRRAEGEKVKPFRSRRDIPALHELRDRIRAWALPLLEEAASLEPDMPVEDRAADTLEPLVIVADLAGGSWPRLARVACARMVVAEVAAEEDHPSGARILADIRRAFFARPAVPCKPSSWPADRVPGCVPTPTTGPSRLRLRSPRRHPGPGRGTRSQTRHRPQSILCPHRPASGPGDTASPWRPDPAPGLHCAALSRLCRPRPSARGLARPHPRHLHHLCPDRGGRRLRLS